MEGQSIRKRYGKKLVLDGIDLSLYFSEVVSLIGASGSGKSTLAQILSGYLRQDEGTILFDGQSADFDSLRQETNGLQMIFQDPDYVLNARLTVFQAVSEPLLSVIDKKNLEELENRVKKVLIDVGLPANQQFWKQKIRSLSGGQKQRVAIARALILEPKVIIADEPTSMLDPSTKANLIRMLKGVQNRRGLSMLFITHDIACAEKISDRIFQLYGGKITNFKN